MNHTAALLDVTTSHDDATVARMIADAALEIERIPYCFSINHNVGAPEYKACPLDYDFRFGKTVGINTYKRDLAHAWIVKAIGLGYTVYRAGCKTKGIKDNEAYGQAYDISTVRSRAARHQRPPLETDDDIPF